MARIANVDREELYDMWIACSRSQSRAAEKLGIPLSTMNYHANQGRFDERYAAEFSGAAKIAHRMATISLMNDWPKLVDAMKGIVLDPDEKGINRISAFRELRSSLPMNIPVDSERAPMSFLDAKATLVPLEASPELSIEEQVREQLEGNILNAQEQRTGQRK